MRPNRVAIVSDYLEEGWPSMDLVAGMLARKLRARHAAELTVSLVRPQFVRRFSRRPGALERRVAFNADRLLNRFFDYPRFLRARRNDFDLFHIVDHTYAHLVPAAGTCRCVVTCHDLDAFRPVIESNGDRNSWVMGKMARSILDGFRQAVAVACDSAATRDAVLRHQLAPAEGLSVNPNGVGEVFNPRPDGYADREVCRLLGRPDSSETEILHVGSTIARKRIDVLLRVFAALRHEMPGARLIRVGGAFTAAQRRLMKELGLPASSVAVLPFLNQGALAAVYRRAALVLLPSEAEGYGLPVLEALACGTPAVISDIPALREVGGPAAAYGPVADLDRWSAVIVELLRERRECPRSWAQRCAAGLRWASQFTWHEYAGRALTLYRRVAAVV